MNWLNIHRTLAERHHHSKQFDSTLSAVKEAELTQSTPDSSKRQHSHRNNLRRLCLDKRWGIEQPTSIPNEVGLNETTPE